MKLTALPEIQRGWDAAKPFQVEDADFASRNGSIVLGHRTGLGKTLIAQLAWSKWPTANKALVVGTLGSTAQWFRLLDRWSGVKDAVFIQGKDDPNWRRAIDPQTKQGIFLCTYMTFLYGMKTIQRGKPYFPLVVNDELHRVMRTRNTMWKHFKRLEFDHYIGMSATWASRGPQDLFPVLNLVNPNVFRSYWDFVHTWCHVDKTPWGTEIYGVRNPEKLREMLFSQYYRARLWSEVGSQFRDMQAGKDPVIRRIEEVDMRGQQIKLVEQLRAEMMAELESALLVTQNSMVQQMRLLQLSISPRILFPDAEPGGVIDWLVEQISDDPHTVVFCPFREGLDVVKEALIKDRYPAENIFIFRGGMQPQEINRSIDLWKKTRGVALITVAFAQSFDLDTTETAYMLGFDWDPNNNYQAEGRLRRLDSVSQSPCLVRYVVPKGSEYHEVMDVVDGKVWTVSQFLQRKLPSSKASQPVK